MKNWINMKMNKIMLLLIVVSVISCGSLLSSPPRLEQRTLRISSSKTGLVYQYKKCKKEKWWKKKKCWIAQDFYDFTDKDIRLLLKHTGFTCTTPRQFQVTP